MPEQITVELGNRDYRGWKGVTIVRSVETFAASFTLQSADPWTATDEGWVAYPGIECKIKSGSDLLLRGYVDAVDARIGSGSHDVAVSGRDRCSDLVDCSIEADPGEWRNVDLLALAKAIAAPFGLSASASTNVGPRFQKVCAKQGETPHALLNRKARERGVLVGSDVDGNVLLYNAGVESSVDAIALGSGGNVTYASAQFDHADRFSRYVVRGASKQVGSGWTKSTVSQQGTAEDLEIARYRPKVSRGEGISSTADLQRQAAWEANVRAARSERARVGVLGFRQSNGALWVPGLLAVVRIPELLLDSTMLVSTVEFHQDEAGGTTSVLGLTIPTAYEPEPPKEIRQRRSTGWRLR